LDLLFSPESFENQHALADLGNAFQNLVARHIDNLFRGTAQEDLILCVRFDSSNLSSFLIRFQRDAFGVNLFHIEINSMVEKVELSRESANKIFDALKSLSIRINTPIPRKTRVAAAFSL